MQYRVLHRVKYDFDIFRIHGSGEMMVQRFFRIPFNTGEQIQNELLHVVHRMTVALELGKVPAYVRFRILHFLFQQIVFVQKQNNRNTTEYDVVHYGVEHVTRLLQPVGFPILEQHLVELRGRNQKEDRGDRIETLEPLLSLWTLSADIDEQEWDVVDGNLEFCNTFGGFPTM